MIIAPKLLGFLLLIPCLFLVSCETPSTFDSPSTYTREGFSLSAPLGGYESHPSADAIVGMWTNTTYPKDQGRLVTSLIFKRDGTGLSRSNELQGDVGIPFSWKYGGDGGWTAFFTASSCVFRIGAQPTGGGRRAIYHVPTVPEGPILQYLQVK